jgi:glycosyltransferase involved in cell wall biosynthesis
MPPDTAIIVCARDESDRLPETLAALRDAFPQAQILVADDGSTDATPDAAQTAGAALVRSEQPIGKGGIATLAARWLGPVPPPVVVLCDGDLGATAFELARLADEVRSGGCDLAVATFARPVGGGLGAASGFARWAVRSLCRLELTAPISGQRALTGELLAEVLPFAPRFGMELAMTIDAARAGYRVAEFELDLCHRPTGRTPSGFAHRGRQLADFMLAYASRSAPRALWATVQHVLGAGRRGR